jgi:hypothetical protein
MHSRDGGIGQGDQRRILRRDWQIEKTHHWLSELRLLG